MYRRMYGKLSKVDWHKAIQARGRYRAMGFPFKLNGYRNERVGKRILQPRKSIYFFFVIK